MKPFGDKKIFFVSFEINAGIKQQFINFNDAECTRINLSVSVPHSTSFGVIYR
jgi:hypothetical protein